MENLFFNNVKLKRDTYYFLYVGEVKGYYLNEFLKQTLKREKTREVDFISIVPDVWERYTQSNLMVINPLAEELSEKLGQTVHVRIPGREFARVVASHPAVRDLVLELLKRQDELYIHMFQTFPEVAFAKIPNVKLLGPNPELSNIWNSKLFMYKKLSSVVPLPPFRFCESREELLEVTNELWDKWSDGIFVSLEYSAAGAFSFLAHSQEEMVEKLGGWKPPFLVTKFIPHRYDPTVLGVVINERDIYIGCVADQCMEQVNKFRGSTYPSILPEKVQESLKDLTRKVGIEMAKTGYRGIFGCDYIIDEGGDIYFVEVNARKQGTTMEMCCTLENSLPGQCPSLMEIEYYAVTRGELPPGCMELAGNLPEVYWGTYNHKVEKDVKTTGRVECINDERKMFQRICGSSPERSDFMVVEHVGKDIIVKSGSFLARVISVAKNRENMVAGLDKGKAIIKNTIEGEN